MGADPRAAEPMNVDSVLFDAYGTLFDVRAVLTACVGTVPDPQVFVDGWRRRQLQYAWLRTLMERYVDLDEITAEALQATAEAERVSLDDETQRRLVAAWLRLEPYPDVLPALQRMRDRRLGILSNGSPKMLTTVLDHTRLADRFTWVLSVDMVRRYKPSPSAYALGTAAVGVDAERILFVSSNGWDVNGAAAFGYRTCWVNRTAGPFDRLGETPSFVVPSLEGLAERIA